MKTTLLDAFLCTLSLTILLLISTLTVHYLPTSGIYQPLLDLSAFLFFYGTYTALLLALFRRFYPYPRGRFKTTSHEFTYWKINAVLVDLGFKALSPFRTVFTEPLIHKSFGASIKKQTAIAGILRDHPLLELKDYCTIGQNSIVSGHIIVRDEIILEPVQIGEGAVIGANSIVMPGVTIGDHAVLAPGSIAMTGARIPAGELWSGSPARRRRTLPDMESADTTPDNHNSN